MYAEIFPIAALGFKTKGAGSVAVRKRSHVTQFLCEVAK